MCKQQNFASKIVLNVSSVHNWENNDTKSIGKASIRQASIGQASVGQVYKGGVN